MCHRILDFAQQFGVQRVVTFAAMGTQLHPEAAPRVFGAVTVPDLLDTLRDSGVRPLQEGRVGGLNGALLAAAAERGIEALCLLGEMPFYAAAVMNPRSSAAVLEAFTAMTGLELDLTRLYDLAEKVEPQMLSLYEQVREQAGQLAEQGLAIFEGDEDDDDEDDDEDVEELDDELVEEQTVKTGTAAGPDDGEQPLLDIVTRRYLEELFDQAGRDRARADDLKQELDRLGVFEQFEDRFLDLFRRAG